MSYNARTAGRFIVAALAGQPAARVADVAARAYAAYAAQYGNDPAAEAVVQLSRSSRGRAYVKVAYAAIAALRRSGNIVSAGSLRSGLIRLANDVHADRLATVSATAHVVTPPPAPTSSPTAPRAAFDAFMAAINGDAANWTQAFAPAEMPAQQSALRALREFLDAADAILQEEGAAPI